MIPPWDVSIIGRNYFALVVFLQLIIADNSGAAMAQNLNSIQQQMNQINTIPQLPAPDLSVGRSNQPSTAPAEHTHRTVHRKLKKQ